MQIQRRKIKFENGYSAMITQLKQNKGTNSHRQKTKSFRLHSLDSKIFLRYNHHRQEGSWPKRRNAANQGLGSFVRLGVY